MARILIVEPHISGHRASYVQWLARRAIEMGHEVHLILPSDSVDHPLLCDLTRMGNRSPRIWIVPPVDIGNGKSLILAAWREIVYYFLLRRLSKVVSRHIKIDHVILPYADYCLHMIGLLGSPFREVPWSGIAMGLPVAALGNETRTPVQSIRIWLIRRALALRETVALFHLCESLNGPGHALSGYSTFKYLPDPAEWREPSGSAAARTEFGLSQTSMVVLVFGSIDGRKGVSELLGALLPDSLDETLQVLICGRCSDDIREFLGSGTVAALRSMGRLVLIDGYVNEDVAARAFGAADVVWLGYVGHSGMSGVLAKAGLARRPVLACNEGEIGWVVRSCRSGLVVNPSDSSAVRGALAALRSPALRSELAENGFRRFSSHTPNAFADLVLTVVAERSANPQ